jgi:hypothetical protein
MPELPDVGIFKKYFQSTALPQTIREVEVRAPELLEGVSAKRLRQELSGLAFSSVARHGKYLFAEAEGGASAAFRYDRIPQVLQEDRPGPRPSPAAGGVRQQLPAGLRLLRREETS